LQFSAKNGSLAVTASGSYADTNALANVTVLGVKVAPASVQLNGKDLEQTTWDYQEASSVLAITQLNNLTSGGAWSSNWTLTWTDETRSNRGARPVIDWLMLFSLCLLSISAIS
jgi:alpha-glucosidase